MDYDTEYGVLHTSILHETDRLDWTQAESYTKKEVVVSESPPRLRLRPRPRNICAAFKNAHLMQIPVQNNQNT